MLNQGEKNNHRILSYKTGSLKQTDRKNRLAEMNRTPITTVNIPAI